MDSSVENSVQSLVPLHQTHKHLELLYLDYRKKIKALYSDAQVKELPRAFTFNPHQTEWKMRAAMVNKFLTYLKKASGAKKILEVGCGNGWLCHRISNTFERTVTGLDVSLFDIEQAHRVFKQSNLSFIHGDFFDDSLPLDSFDLIVLSNTIHQFPNLRQLIERCHLHLKSRGELHIFDSPIYKWQELEKAREDTAEYYDSLQLPSMNQLHFHHSWDDLYPFKYRVLYSPQSLRAKLTSYMKINLNPYPWVRIKKEN